MRYFARLEDIHKYFGTIKALEDIDFRIKPSEVVGLVGDNGAGKSTLIKVITGNLKPDKGKIFIKDKEMNPKNYNSKKARELGIETVYQSRALAENQPLWRNIFMGREISTRVGFLRKYKMRRETKKILKEYIGFTSEAISPNIPVKTLSGGEMQGVAIARALYFDADLIILDEPTTALSLEESRKVLNYITNIKKKGKSCIFVTHTISHVFTVADRFIILDRGRKAKEFEKGDLSEDKLIEIMINIAKHGVRKD